MARRQGVPGALGGRVARLAGPSAGQVRGALADHERKLREHIEAGVLPPGVIAAFDQFAARVRDQGAADAGSR